MSTAVTRRNRVRTHGAPATPTDVPTRANAAAPRVPPVSLPTMEATAGDAGRRDQEKNPKRKYTVSAKAIDQRKAAAQKSTGPKTIEGKATSSRNAVEHGMTAFATSILVEGEDPAAYDELYQALRRQCPPLNAVGEYAVRALANALWRSSQRIDLAEAALIIKERERLAFDQMIAGLTAAHPGGQAPVADQLRTGAGVAQVLKWIAMSVEDLPASIEETDARYWEMFRRNAEALARVVPELAKFAQAEPSDEVLAGWRAAAALATNWLTAREASLRAHEQARAATRADSSLVPSGHDMRLLVRYASMNDRKIEKLLKLIDKHCGQSAENDT